MIRLHFFLTIIILFLGFSELGLGKKSDGSDDDDSRGGDDGGGRGSDDSASSAPAATPTSTASANGSPLPGSGLTGDSQCPGSRLMCITATSNGSIVTYALQSQDSQMGWMAIGFGGQMTGSPMVIMWPNPDNTITLSQRMASGEVMPTTVPSPARIATVATPLSTINGGLSKLTFTIDASYTQSTHIFAFGNSAPSPQANAVLAQHLESGPFALDLTKPIASNSSDPNASPSTPPGGPISVPLLPYQKTIIAHAAITTFGFLVLLPLGAILARYTRSYSPKWFTGHWVLQGPMSGIFVIVGVVLAFAGVKQHGIYTSSRHKTLGKVLLGLYLGQAALGIFIHFIKISAGFRRPPQNYVHAILGLTTIALALYQVRLGFTQEWPGATGRGSVPKSINIVWIIWVILLPVLYFAGLAYLPRQLRQERPNFQYTKAKQQSASE